MKIIDTKTVSRIATLSVAGLIAIGPALAETPKEFYQKYRTAFDSARKIDDLQPLLCKKANEEISRTPAEMKPMMFGLMKDTSPQQVQVLTEQVNGDKATLTLTGKSGIGVAKTKEKTTGTVTLVKESGNWKIDKEKWSTKIEIEG